MKPYFDDCGGVIYHGNCLEVVDGAGTVGIAAQAQHLRWIGIELNEDYCEIAARRLSQSVLDFSKKDAQQTGGISTAQP